jgi:hypothetical protein
MTLPAVRWTGAAQDVGNVTIARVAAVGQFAAQLQGDEVRSRHRTICSPSWPEPIKLQWPLDSSQESD